MHLTLRAPTGVHYRFRAIMSHGGCHAQVKSPQVLNIKKARRFRVGLVLYIKPGSDLLSHGNSHTIIGAELFHFCVRDGNRWDQLAMAARHNWLLALQAS